MAILKKKKMLVILIIASAVAIVTVICLIVLLPNSTVDITDTPDSGTQEVAGDVGQEEEGIDAVPDEPPFLETLRTGVYGYDALVVLVNEADERTTEQNIFVCSDGSRAVVVRFYEGELEERCIYDYEKNVSYQFFEKSKTYRVVDDYNMLTKNLGIADFRSSQSEIDRGTADCFGETLDYIDYGSGIDAVRVFIKEGDIYAIKTQEVEKAAFFVLKTYSSPPTTEYLDISNMNNYELMPG